LEAVVADKFIKSQFLQARRRKAASCRRSRWLIVVAMEPVCDGSQESHEDKSNGDV
jgi:hypothetical protein